MIDEDYLFHITTGSHVAQICIFLLTESRCFPGRLIQSSPPPRSRLGLPGDYAINTADPILLTGPTGAGKSLLARRIFDLRAARRQVSGAFVEVNCATLRGDAMASALFGHVKGAFTGAVKDRPGLLRAADRGVILLGELARHEVKTGRKAGFNREGLKAFLDFATGPAGLWKANFRNLNNAVARMATLAKGGRIGVEEAAEEIARLSESWKDPGIEDQDGILSEILGTGAAARLDLFDRIHLLGAIRVCMESASL